SPSESCWPGLTVPGQSSQASPIPSPSVSTGAGSAVVGQLSQASPRPSPSESSCPGLGTAGQLSALSAIPSPSRSPGLPPPSPPVGSKDPVPARAVSHPPPASGGTPRVGQPRAGHRGHAPERRIRDRRLGGTTAAEDPRGCSQQPLGSPATFPFTIRSHS